jgi:hypothetical protein
VTSRKGPFKALTLAAAVSLPEVAEADASSVGAYIVVSLLIGARTEELRALTWSLRHSFVSLRSDARVPIEQIARLVGHSGTSVTEQGYRHQLRPVLEDGATAMDVILPTRGA